jgi:hypothetical protein
MSIPQRGTGSVGLVVAVALCIAGVPATAAGSRVIHGSTSVKRITSLPDYSDVESDERYVSFRVPSDPVLRFYDSKRRRVIRGPVGCTHDSGDAEDTGAHGLFVVVCPGSSRPFLYSVHDRRTIAIKGTIAPNEDVEGVGRYWIHLLSGPVSSPGDPDLGSDDVYLQWRTGRRIECGGTACWEARNPRHEYTFADDFDLDSKRPRRDRWLAMAYSDDVVDVERPYVLRTRVSRWGDTLLILSRGRRSRVLDRGDSLVPRASMVGRRVLWAVPGHRPLIEAYDIPTHQSAKWRVGPRSAHREDPAPFMTRYEAIFGVPNGAGITLYGTRWPTRGRD